MCFYFLVDLKIPFLLDFFFLISRSFMAAVVLV